MFTSVMYLLDDNALKHVQEVGLVGILNILKNCQCRTRTETDMKQLKIIRNYQGRCYYDFWALYVDKYGAYWLHHHECDSSD